MQDYLYNSFVQSGFYADSYSILMNSYHISKFEEALGTELVFKELENIVMSDPNIPLQEKRNCLLVFKLQFLEFSLDSAIGTSGKNNKVELFKEFRKIVFEIQTGDIKDSIKLPVPFTYKYGYNPVITVTKTVSLSPAQLNSFFSEYGLPNQHRNDRFYYKKDGQGSSIAKSFRALLALENFGTFKYRFYNEMKEIEASLNADTGQRTTQDRPYTYYDNKLFFQIFEKTGTTQDSPKESGASYAWYRMIEEGERQYFELDFSQGADSKQNEVNLLRIYTAILIGNTIRVSTKKETFKLGSTSTVSKHIVAQISSLGCFVINKRNSPDSNDIERRLNSMMDSFFKDTDTSRSLKVNNDHLLLPYSHPYAIFDILFMTRGKNTLELRKEIINKYVNFVKLGKIMENKKNGDAEDRKQYGKWKKFVIMYGKNPDLASLKIENVKQLKAFLDSVLVFQDESFNVGSPLENVLFLEDGSFNGGLPLGLINAIDRGEGYYIDPSEYEVVSGFQEALYLDGYLK